MVFIFIFYNSVIGKEENLNPACFCLKNQRCQLRDLQRFWVLLKIELQHKQAKPNMPNTLPTLELNFGPKATLSNRKDQTKRLENPSKEKPNQANQNRPTIRATICELVEADFEV